MQLAIVRVCSTNVDRTGEVPGVLSSSVVRSILEMVVVDGHSDIGSDLIAVLWIFVLFVIVSHKCNQKNKPDCSGLFSDIINIRVGGIDELLAGDRHGADLGPVGSAAIQRFESAPVPDRRTLGTVSCMTE